MQEHEKMLSESQCQIAYTSQPHNSSSAQHSDQEIFLMNEFLFHFQIALYQRHSPLTFYFHFHIFFSLYISRLTPEKSMVKTTKMDRIGGSS